MVLYRRRPAVERSLPGGRRLVQPLDAVTPSMLAGSAPLVWDLLETCDQVESVVAKLCERFDDSVEVIGSGVDAALHMMLAEHLVEAVSHQ